MLGGGREYFCRTTVIEENPQIFISGDTDTRFFPPVEKLGSTVPSPWIRILKTETRIVAAAIRKSAMTTTDVLPFVLTSPNQKADCVKLSIVAGPQIRPLTTEP